MKAADIARNSIIFRAASGVSRAYSLSFTARIFKGISNLYKNSRVFSLLHSGKHGEPAGKYSLSQKVLKNSLISADKVAGGINSLLSKSYKFSIPAKIAASVNTTKKAGAAVLFFAAGYAIGNTVLGKWSLFRIIFICAVAVFSAAVYFTGDKWKSWYKNGLLNRIVNFLFEK